jgi:hypothetical protein
MRFLRSLQKASMIGLNSLELCPHCWSIHANKLSRDDNTDGNGSKLCVAPPVHLGVYTWYLSMENNDLMNQKGSATIPAAARHQDLVGNAGSYAKHQKTIASHRAKDPQNVHNISDSDSDSTQ